MRPFLALLRGAAFLAMAALPLAAAPAPASAPASTTPPASSALTQDDLLKALARDLSAHFDLQGDLQLTLLRAWAPPAESATKWTITVVDYPNVMSPALLVHATIRADEAAAVEQTFFVGAALWRDAWAARTPLVLGAVFDPSALDVRRVDALRERDALPTSTGDSNFVFARSIPADRLLTWRDLSRRPLVHKGQMVEVTATDGALSVTMKAVAMKSGARGETVTLRNPDSQKDFSAIVIDENRAQIHL